MERKLGAPVATVFALLTDPKWLQARCLALGELSASCKARKSAGDVVVTMRRRVHRDLNALIAKVLNPDSDIEIEERWIAADGGYTGSYTLQIVGKPVTVTAEFALQPQGKGSVYRIQHSAEVRVPLVGGVVEKFVIGQSEQACADELDYLVENLKARK